MPDLTELQRLAEDAGNRLPGEEWFDEYELRSILMAHEQDARLIAAMSPDTAKKLIAVAQWADALVNPPQMATGYHQRKQREADEESLRTALAELAGSPQERREG